jgi:LysM repeat protein
MMVRLIFSWSFLVRKEMRRMKSRLWMISLIVVILMSTLSACSRSASNAPVATPTANSNIPFPTPLPSSAIGNVLASTQTAQALGNPTAGAAATATTDPNAAQTTAPTAEVPVATVAPVQPTPTTVQPTMIVVPSATPGRPATYTLQQGEFPFCIARRFNVDAGTLLSVNGLNLNSHPAAGTVLTIPQSGTWSSGARALLAHPTTYSVSAGESIYSIACVFGDVDPNAIIVANALKSPYTLSAGQTLNIP